MGKNRSSLIRTARSAVSFSYLPLWILALSLPACQAVGPFRSGLKNKFVVQGGNFENQATMAEHASGSSNRVGRSPASSPGLIWPIEAARLTQGFSAGPAVHQGIDLAAPMGTSIYAAHSGTVLFSGNGFTGYGNFIILEDDDWSTIYSHCRELLVKNGQEVRKGQVIATVGQSGHATGPHLHFEVRLRRGALDPLVYLPPDSQIRTSSISSNESIGIE